MYKSELGSQLVLRDFSVSRYRSNNNTKTAPYQLWLKRALCIIMKFGRYVITTVSGVITGSIGLWIFSFPRSMGEVGILAWLTAPYIYIAFLIAITSNRTTLFIEDTICVVFCALGAWFIYDSFYVNPDAQGALTLFFIPLWQLAILAISTLPIVISRKPINA